MQINTKQLRDELKECIHAIMSASEPTIQHALALRIVVGVQIKISSVYLGVIERLNKVSYISPEVGLVTAHFDEDTSESLDEAIANELPKEIYKLIKPGSHKIVQEALKKIDLFEKKIKKLYLEKVQSLKAPQIPDSTELPSQDEIIMLASCLAIMLYDGALEEVYSGKLLVSLSKKDDKFKSILNIIHILQAYKLLTDDKATEQEILRSFYKTRQLGFINIDTLYDACCQALEHHVASCGLRNPARDESHSKAIIKRLSKIQLDVSSRIKPIVKAMHDDFTDELNDSDIDDIAQEIRDLRDEIKLFTQDKDVISLFSAPESAVDEKISDVLNMIAHIKRLDDEETVTLGDKAEALQAYSSLLSDKLILKKYRVAIETIFPKLKSASIAESATKVYRLVFVIQHVMRTLKNKLLELKEEPEFSSMASSDSAALTASNSPTLALTN